MHGWEYLSFQVTVARAFRAKLAKHLSTNMKLCINYLVFLSCYLVLFFSLTKFFVLIDHFLASALPVLHPFHWVGKQQCSAPRQNEPTTGEIAEFPHVYLQCLSRGLPHFKNISKNIFWLYVCRKLWGEDI